MASGELDQLIADRATLEPCSCSQVDADIAMLESARDAQEDVIENWN